MTPRMVGGAKRINVILSAAKNLLHLRGIAGMPRSFAQDDNRWALAEKIDTLESRNPGFLRLPGPRFRGG